MADGWRRAGKAAGAALLHHSGLRAVLTRMARHAAGGRRLLILAYHRVVEDFEGESQRVHPGLLVSARTFARHLEAVRAAGFDILPLAEALEANAGVRRGRRDVAVLTFDDGYRDNHDVAHPLLQRHGAPATIYLPTGFIGTGERLPHDRLYHLLRLAHARARREPRLFERLGGADPWAPLLPQEPMLALDRHIARWPHAEILRFIDRLAERLDAPAAPESGALLDWDQCRRLVRGGLVTFGAHTVRHVPLHFEPPEVVERELREGREAVERELGVPCRDFAYPNGYHSKDIVRALVAAGYRSAVTTEDNPNVLRIDPFRLRRKTLWENHSRGLGGAFSPALLGCQLDGVFGMLGLQRAVPGARDDVAGVAQLPAWRGASEEVGA